MTYKLTEFKTWLAEEESRKGRLDWELVFSSEKVFNNLIHASYPGVREYFNNDFYLFNKYLAVIDEWKEQSKIVRRWLLDDLKAKERAGTKKRERLDEILQLPPKPTDLETDTSSISSYSDNEINEVLTRKQKELEEWQRTSKKPTTFLRKEIKLWEKMGQLKQELDEAKQEITALEESDLKKDEILVKLLAEIKQKDQALTNLQTQITDKEQALAQKFAQLTAKLKTAEQQAQTMTNLQEQITQLKTHQSQQLKTLKEQAQASIERVVRDKELEIEDLAQKLTILQQRTKEDNYWTNLPKPNNLLILLGIIILGYLIIK